MGLRKCKRRKRTKIGGGNQRERCMDGQEKKGGMGGKGEWWSKNVRLDSVVCPCGCAVLMLVC